jgi:hypothetical protein
MKQALAPLLVLALAAGVDPELEAIAKRCYPSDDDEARRAREREEENREKLAEERKRLKQTGDDAANGIYGKGVMDAARAILEEGKSETHYQRVRKLVYEWRRAGRARKSGKAKKK